MIYRRLFDFLLGDLEVRGELTNETTIGPLFEDSPGQRVSAGVFPLINLTEDKTTITFVPNYLV